MNHDTSEYRNPEAKMAAIQNGKRRATKAVQSVAPARVKMSASVRAETYMKLATHALYDGKTQGELIDEMTALYCRRYQVRDMEASKRPAEPSEDGDRPNLDGPGSESAAAEAA